MHIASLMHACAPLLTPCCLLCPYDNCKLYNSNLPT